MAIQVSVSSIHFTVAIPALCLMRLLTITHEVCWKLVQAL
jgi:hypothetical protein